MLENLLREYGYFFIYFGTLFEPDATLVAATFLAHRGYFHIPVVFVVATISTLSMSQFWFWLGRRKGKDLLDRMTLKNERYGRIRSWVERHGTLLVFASRFLWGLRLAVATVSGATGVSPTKFILVDTAGAIVWTGVIGTVGYGIAHAIGTFFSNIRKHEYEVALGLLLVIALFALWKQREQKIELAALRHPEELGISALHHVEQKIGPRPERP